MNQVLTSSARFSKLEVQNYGIFLGEHHFQFGRNRTVIVAENGSGKTTILRALSGLESPPNFTSYVLPNNLKTRIELVINGNPKLIEEYRDLIFFEGLEYSDHSVADYLAPNQITNVASKMRELFELTRPYTRESVRSVTDEELLRGHLNLGIGDIAFIKLLSSVATREELGLDIPLVIERPYDSMDIELKTASQDLLEKQSFQVILLVPVFDEDIEPIHDYKLRWRGSRVEVRAISRS